MEDSTVNLLRQDLLKTDYLKYFSNMSDLAGTKVFEYKGGMKEGKILKMVNEVDQKTFEAKRALKNGQRVLYVTERAVFELLPEGLRLKEIASGVDLKNDILGKMAFKPIVDDELEVMPVSLFKADKVGLRELNFNH